MNNQLLSAHRLAQAKNDLYAFIREHNYGPDCAFKFVSLSSWMATYSGGYWQEVLQVMFENGEIEKAHGSMLRLLEAGHTAACRGMGGSL